MATVIDITSPAGGANGASDRYIDFGDVVGGALVATALTLVLVSFGSAIGLSLVSAEPGNGTSLRWLAVGSGLWFIWQAVTSAAAGGYFAGRMRRPILDASPDEVETRDGAHGVAVWALATLITALLAAAGVGGAVRLAGAIAGGAADTVAAAVNDSAVYRSGIALRSDRGVPSREARAEMANVLAKALTDEPVTEADRSYLTQLVAAETRLDASEARSRVDEMIANAERDRATAVEAADQARVFAVIGAFIVAASILLSAAAAYFAAVLGGTHRNEGVGFARFRREPRRGATRS